MSRYIHHEPCPKCGSRNNLAVYDDGHKWCFGCRYYVPPPQSNEALRKRLEGNMGGQVNIPQLDRSSANYSYVLPIAAIKWLRKYGISDEEIKSSHIMWNSYTDSLVFPLFGRNDKDEQVIVVTNERYFGDSPDHPKYKTYGPKSKAINVFTNSANDYDHDVVVAVEDMVSCIKVSRHFPCVALLGATMPQDHALKLSEAYKHLRIWLDMDKASQAVVEASKASQFVRGTSRVIITDLDPKEYSDREIYKTVLNSLDHEETP